MQPHRLTKIVCTLGPASASEAQIRELADGGMNIARINLSHGTHEEHSAVIAAIRKVNKGRSMPVGILLDTKGAEIRTGDVQTPLTVKAGDEVTFVPESDPRAAHPGDGIIAVNYDGFADDIRETKVILIDNGELSFDILSIGKDRSVRAKARQDGEIGSRRHVNLPGADIDLPALTDKDWDDVTFSAQQAVDFIALSFIRTADEVEQVRDFLRKHKASSIALVSKIETAQAVENIAEIIRVSDGIMVARGDLGAEVPFESLPAIQDEIVVRCSDAGKPVIVATHMLESMKNHPIPTRAEMTDVAHAATEKADSTMLSGETATGRHPPVALEAMDRILRATEQHITRFAGPSDIRMSDDEYDARSQAAVNLARTTDAAAILVFTRSGRTAQQVSKFRPNVPIIACTNAQDVQQKMTLLFGVYPLLIRFGDPEATITNGMNALLQSGLIQSGSKLILVSDVPKELADWSIQQRTL
jgi:pyruvate kinase